jgi:hypothetical protein
MILDEAIKQFFQKNLDIPDIFTGIERMRVSGQAGYGLKNISLQVVRGMPLHLWKDAPPAGCSRHMAIFMTFGAIPKYCFDCYKLLIEPRTVMELFKLLKCFERIELPNDNTRKCMIEARKNISGSYKGLVYCRGLEDANEVCRLVKEAVADDISPDIPITLKRGCSEYAQAYPNYGQVIPGKEAMEYKNDWAFYEKFADENFIFGEPAAAVNEASDTPPLWDLFAMQFWLKYAAAVGDKSYLAITGGKAIQPLGNSR